MVESNQSTKGYDFIFGDEDDIDKSEMDERKRYQYKKWVTFYRLNMHQFAIHYLGLIGLKWFQKVMIYLMGLSSLFVTIASRGISKSYTIGLYAVCRSILYPGSRIVISSGKMSAVQ